jgi:hypothetical protein
LVTHWLPRAFHLVCVCWFTDKSCCLQNNVVTNANPRVVTPGCQIGHMDHTGCHQSAVVWLSLQSRVSELVTYNKCQPCPAPTLPLPVLFTESLTPMHVGIIPQGWPIRGCQIGYMDHTAIINWCFDQRVVASHSRGVSDW